MTRIAYYARKVHRLFAYLLFLQMIAWILGGATFALLPFEGLVKGGSVVSPPQREPLPPGWLQALAPYSREGDTPRAIETAASSQGALAKVVNAEGETWVRLADGRPARRPDPEQIAAYADALYQGQGDLVDVRFLEQPEARYLGLVDELYGRRGVWLASFSDWQDTRLYFDGATGRYLTVRNDFWVFYDAMWRLHIMDYGGGENFNNLLLRITVILAAGFLVSGLVLAVFNARRALRRRP